MNRKFSEIKNSEEWQTIFRDTLPVLTGYVSLGIGFGILMQSAGYGLLPALLMSLTIYAGSMQFAAIGLFTGGASFLTVALTTIAVNARHLFYGISMIDRYKNAGRKKPYMIFALTDETYSLNCSSDNGTDYYFKVSLVNQIYWITGTLIGCLIGNLITFDTTGLDFSMTALFITIVTDQWLKTKNHFAALTGIIISILCLIIFGKSSFLIPSMFLIMAVLLLFRSKPENTKTPEE